MKEENSNLLQQKCFDNGVCVNIYDRCRQIAGDRWQVQVVSEVSLNRHSLAEQVGRLGRDFGPLPSVDDLMSDLGCMVIDKIRNFVDDGEKQAVVEELIDQVFTTMGPYLQSSAFPEKFVVSQLQKRKQQECVVIEDTRFVHLDKNDGPADFSSLFAE